MTKHTIAEAAVNISEHNSREHTSHPSIDDMTR